MSKPTQPDKQQSDFARKVGEKSNRRIKARRNEGKKTWFGLGMMGLVGWSVAVPTLIGIFLGIWIDSTGSRRFSWTLMLLIGGIALGCINVWYWLRKEEHDLAEDEKQKGGDLDDE